MSALSASSPNRLGKVSMRNLTSRFRLTAMIFTIMISTVIILSFALTTAYAQNQAQSKDKPAKAVHVALPSDDTVNGFMRHTFGFDPGTTWKSVKIQAPPYGLAEVGVAVVHEDQLPG